MASWRFDQLHWLFITCSLIFFIAMSFTMALPSNANNKLRFVQVIMNSGKRSPREFFTNDPNNVLWTMGPGKLLEAGKQETFQLGRWFRTRYGPYLSNTFRDDEIYFRSSDEENQLLSCQIFAAGLYSQSNGMSVWNDQFQSTLRPVPINTLPISMDPFAEPYILDKCTRMQQFLNMLQNTPEERRVSSNTRFLSPRVLQDGGKRLDTPKQFLDVCDILTVEKANNLKFPDWIKGQADIMLQMRDYYTFRYIKTPEIAQLSGGYMIREIMQRMKDVIANNLNKLKAYIYSTNEYAIMYILSTLRLNNYILPPYSSALILELYEDPRGEFFLQILYDNDTRREPYILNFPTCPHLCPYQFVHDMTKCYFIDDISGLCDLRFTREEIAQKQQELNQLYP